jgi:8-oxo-dGTP pyrophosphatase MutT (NUDIX family)
VDVLEQIRRTTARVVPVNRRDEALLMLSCDPANPSLTYWCSFGGAVDEGETLAEAGARELREETGLVVSDADLGRPFDRSEVTFPYDGAVFVNDSTWFAVRLEAEPAALHTHDDLEQILAYQWWHLDDLEREPGLNNERLPAIVGAAVAHLGAR